MELRDRIAAALWGFARPNALLGMNEMPEVFLDMAEAVIAALGLREECAPDIAGERWGVHVRYVSDETFIPGEGYPE